MSKKQGQKSVKDVLRDNLLQIYRGKKNKREDSGNFFSIYWFIMGKIIYLDDNRGAWFSRLR